ncbi:MAG: glycosyltransferase family 39 protein [bacterium]
MKLRYNARYATAAGVVALTLVGAYFRLVRLGVPALRADSLEFWRICQQPVTAAGIFTDWMNLLGISGQFPFPMAATKWFMDTFRLPVTFFGLRLPSALWGIATIPVAFGLGRRLCNARCGFLLALLFALNPFHIQMSREAYFYPPLVLGACMALWGSVWSVQSWKDRQQRAAGLPFSFYLLNLAGFFLLTYSQPTGWTVGLICGGCTVLAQILKSPSITQLKTWTSQAWFLIAGYVVTGLPLLFAPWALPQLRQITQGGIREASMKAVAVSTETFGGMMFKAATSFAWGATFPRALLTLAALVGGMVVIARCGRTRKHLLLLPILIIGGIISFMLAREQAGALFESRYVIGLLPAYLCMLALGLLEAPALLVRALKGNERTSGAVAAVVSVAASLLLLYPAHLCTAMTGQPTPYWDIVHWADKNLPRGTPVLVDRWFEPWNELRVHPPSNVVFTFTIPNEPVEVFLQKRWRDTARSFFARYPDAAYLEIAKEYWDVAGVGNWDWPRQYFAHHVGITNVAGVKLRELGLASRGDFYASTTNRLVVEIFYNTREDNILRMKREGRMLDCFFGEGWGFEKSGPVGFLRIQTSDFHDWRVLERTATLDIVNVGDASVVVRMVVRGIAVGSAKQVQITSDLKHTFGARQMDEWPIGPLELQPGINQLKLTDPLWDMARVPLLVDRVQVLPVTPAAATTNGAAPGGS